MQKRVLCHWVKLVREPMAAEEAGLYGNGEGIRDAASVALALKDRAAVEEVEVFWALHLDGKNRVTGVHEVSRGSMTATLVHPREVFRTAIIAGAASIILAHNHPSGDPKPSAEDQAITERMKAAGELVGIKVLDHVVLGGAGRFVSLAESSSWR